jgi:thioredoxin 1
MKIAFWLVPALLIGILAVSATLAQPATLDDARATARRENKSLMVLFGASWCPDCAALNEFLESSPAREYAEQNFVVHRVDVGAFDKNLDLARSLDVALDGIPTAVFFSPDGTRIGATNGGELATSQKYGSQQILRFLRDVAERKEITMPR